MPIIRPLRDHPAAIGENRVVHICMLTSTRVRPGRLHRERDSGDARIAEVCSGEEEVDKSQDLHHQLREESQRFCDVPAELYVGAPEERREVGCHQHHHSPFMEGRARKRRKGAG